MKETEDFEKLKKKAEKLGLSINEYQKGLNIKTLLS